MEGKGGEGGDIGNEAGVRERSGREGPEGECFLHWLWGDGRP